MTLLNYGTVAGQMGEMLRAYGTSSFRTGYVSVRGVTLPEYFRQFGDRIQAMDVFDSDVWVCSFPKTGTTWTQEMVWCIANDMDLDGAKQCVDTRFPFLELSPLFDYSTVLKEHPEISIALYVSDSVAYVAQQPRPRFIKTHLPWGLLPRQIRDGSKKPKIIYVTRNPKDTCVSYYHHCRLLEGYSGNFEDFVTLFTGDRVNFGPYWGNVLDFWKRRNDENILFIRYEDMKRDLRSVIDEVAKFLNKNLSENQIETLLKHLSFESMKNNKAVNYEHAIEFNKQYKLIDTNGGAFLRSGTVGGYKSEMTPEMIARFDSWIEEKLAGTDFQI